MPRAPIRPLAAAAALLLLAAAPVRAATGMQVGVEDDPAFTGHAASANHAFAAVRGLRAGVVRVLVVWADVRGADAYGRRVPRRRHYDFHAYDGVVTRALQSHIDVQVVLTGPAPAWATADHRKGVNAPRAGYFGEFARQAAQWFGPRVERYSVWNEPNWRGWLEPQSLAPAMYRGLYTHAWSNIKRVNPNAQVLIGETAPYYERYLAIAPLAFLRAVLCNGRCHLLTDGYAHHPYEFSHSPYYRAPGGDNVTIGTLDRLSAALRHWASVGALRTPARRVPDVYLTEFGYLSSGSKRIDDRRHARYLAEAFQIALRTAHVRELVQYTLVPPPRAYGFFDMSIMTRRWTPRAPFRALAAWDRVMQARRVLAVPQY